MTFALATIGVLIVLFLSAILSTLNKIFYLLSMFIAGVHQGMFGITEEDMKLLQDGSQGEG